MNNNMIVNITGPSGTSCGGGLWAAEISNNIGTLPYTYVLELSYELEMPENGYFEIHELDKLNKRVLIKFKATFKLTSKNGNGITGLKAIMKFEGIFNEKY